MRRARNIPEHPRRHHYFATEPAEGAKGNVVYGTSRIISEREFGAGNPLYLAFRQKQMRFVYIFH